MNLYEVRLERAMSCRTSRSALSSILSSRDIVSKCRTAAAAGRAATISSPSIGAAVSTALVVTPWLCYSCTTALLVTTRLGDTGTLVASRLGHASACVRYESRNCELLDGWRGLGNLSDRLALRILIRERCHLLG